MKGCPAIPCPRLGRLAPDPTPVPAPGEEPLDRPVLVLRRPVDPERAQRERLPLRRRGPEQRGNQARSTPITRPSDSPAHIRSPSKRTVSAIAKPTAPSSIEPCPRAAIIPGMTPKLTKALHAVEKLPPARQDALADFLLEAAALDEATPIAELKALLAAAEASGVGDRSMADLIAAARDEARERGLLGER